MYENNARNVYVKNSQLAREWAGPDGLTDRKTPPQWLLDKMADESISKGYNLSRKNLCNTCFEYKSSNGHCGCEE